MDIAYVVVVAISAGMVVAGTVIAIINCCNRKPIEVVEWKNPVIIS
jgi:hypothetical protein